MSTNGEGKKRISVLTPENEMTAAGTFRTPRIAILESPEEFVVKAELPGIGPEDIDIKVDHGRLVLEAHRKGLDAERLPAVVRGRDLDDYRRTFTIGRGIDASHLRAVMNNDGVLVLHLPKRQDHHARLVAITEN